MQNDTEMQMFFTKVGVRESVSVLCVQFSAAVKTISIFWQEENHACVCVCDPACARERHERERQQPIRHEISMQFEATPSTLKRGLCSCW